MEFMKSADANKLVRLAGWALVILILFLAVQTLSSFKEWRGVNPAYNSISVTGEGEIVAVPDVASFSFSVSADAGTVAAAQEAVTEKMDAVLEGLEGMGVEEKDIKTSNYSVYPKYRYESFASPVINPPSRQVLDGYTASHSVEVKVRDTEKAGQALGVAGDNGATNISGISFTVDDPDQVLEEARALAIADAKAKAKALSDDLGVRLVRVVNFYDSTQNPPMPYGMGSDTMMMREQSVSASAPQIPQGENMVRVNVTVTYEIR